ncbi:MAG: WhiB family transcriptional regulator [Aeromicrobium sp.]|uniref:WhiB family transcriptional regulator n=1 Tax=Aeromicrobium sp. TaxID=1871063 RepID=UPI0039E2D4CF
MTRRSDPARTDALAHLMQGLHAHVEAGRRVPCVEPERGHWWLSDDPEHVEAAAHACAACPALDACRDYVTAHPEHAGVWAGADQSTDRRQPERTEPK